MGYRSLTPRTQALIDELARLESVNRLARYWIDEAGQGGMSPGQQAFHQDSSRKRFLRCGNKVGKTFAISAEVWSYLLGRHPYRPAAGSPCTVLYVVSDLDSSYSDDVCKRLRELEPHGVLHPKCRYDTVRGYMVQGRRGIMLRGGEQVIFRSGRQEGGALAGLSADVVVVNEPPKRVRWGEIMRAAAETNAPILMAFTPIDHTGGINRQNLLWLRNIVEAAGSTWSQTVIPLTASNCPHRTPDDIEEQLANIPPWERAQRINGDWEGSALDRLFEGFDDRPVDEGGNIAGEADVPTHEVQVGITFDHGEAPGREVCLLYLYWQDERDRAVTRVLVLDEYISKGRTTSDMDALHVNKMLDKYSLGLFHVDRAHGDVNTQGKSQIASVNDALEQAFADLARVPHHRPPFMVQKPSKGPGSILYGCRVLNSAFLGGRLMVHKRCGTLIHALRNWQGTARGDDKELTHTLDAARYGLADLLDTTQRAVQRIEVV